MDEDWSERAIVLGGGMAGLLATMRERVSHPDTNAELYGRVLCGLEPNTDYV